MGILVGMSNLLSASLGREIQFIHMPVPKARRDDAYFRPLSDLELGAGTELYLGLVHHDDAAGDAARLATARRYAPRIDGVAAECGMGRGDPEHLDALLDAHLRLTQAS
jgi:hypothetical protein